jgi:hypothetical protein
MSKLIFGLTLALAVAFTAPGVSSAKAASPKADKVEKAEKSEGSAAAPSDKEADQKLKEHLRLRNHIVKNVKYPATKEALVASFKTAKAIKADDKKWVEETLPARIYDTSDDVIKALGWEVAPPQ